jgi:hypothetical protein
VSPTAATVTGVADSVTRVLIAVLVLAAVVVVVAGLVRARYGRRRPQLVITDMVSVDWLEDSVTPGLSSLLRQYVRRRLREPSGPSALSLLNTVQPDIQGGILELTFASVGDVARVEGEVLSTQRDELTMVAGGIHALAPTRAEGVIGALSVALPPQRGLLVQPTPLSREVGGQCQIGLTLDAGPLGRGPDASATFWSDVIPEGCANEKLAQRSKLLELLEPAGTWIALHVIGENLTVDTAARMPHGMKRQQQRVGCAQERDALRAILTAQLAGYEMNRMLDQPAIALGFSDQAIEDAHRASEVLPRYHRPHYIAATVHDHRGTCYELLQRGDSVPPTGVVLDTYRKKAATAYLIAEEEFRTAEEMLADHRAAAKHDQKTKNGHDRAETREGVRIRRLKAALHGSNARVALDELDRDGVKAITPDQHYNAACLYAAAAAYCSSVGGNRTHYARLALRELAESLLDRRDYTPHALADPELSLGLDLSIIQNLCKGARNPQTVELAAADRDQALTRLVDSAYSDA